MLVVCGDGSITSGGQPGRRSASRQRREALSAQRIAGSTVPVACGRFASKQPWAAHVPNPLSPIPSSARREYRERARNAATRGQRARSAAVTGLTSRLHNRATPVGLQPQKRGAESQGISVIWPARQGYESNAALPLVGKNSKQGDPLGEGGACVTSPSLSPVCDHPVQVLPLVRRLMPHEPRWQRRKTAPSSKSSILHHAVLAYRAFAASHLPSAGGAGSPRVQNRIAESLHARMSLRRAAVAAARTPCPCDHGCSTTRRRS
jgi:hypothetical protein